MVIGKTSPCYFPKEMVVVKIYIDLFRGEMVIGKIYHPVFFGLTLLRQMRAWLAPF